MRKPERNTKGRNINTERERKIQEQKKSVEPERKRKKTDKADSSLRKEIEDGEKRKEII